MPRPTDIRRSPVAEAIRELRLLLGESQQKFAVRLGMSAVTIARYETNRAPSHRTLQRLSLLANEKGHERIARILGDAAKLSDPLAPQATKRVLLTGAFHKFLEEADSARTIELERLLSKEFHALREQFARLGDESIVACLNEIEAETAQSAQDRDLRASAWILENGGRDDFRSFAVETIRDLIDRRGSSLSATELETLGELGHKALARQAEIEDWQRKVKSLSLAEAVQGLRSQLSLNPSQLAQKLGIPAEALRSYERGDAPARPAGVLTSLLSLALEHNIDNRTSAEFQIIFDYLMTRSSDRPPNTREQHASKSEVSTERRKDTSPSMGNLTKLREYLLQLIKLERFPVS